ncbi:substrate-binding domain-containing protein [Streptomyces olivaceoviridis]|uniref:substrate-binding domain-containing protein n=1 Tax=Streptomyces olivaceoviridis TaxID=1921 RepID=UPI0036F9921A
MAPAGAWQVATDFSGEAGARATRSLLTAAPADRPAAIVYDNDIMAVAAEMGLRVPADVSLPAWDDSQLCRLTHPTLSAMSHDEHGFGAEVARTLFGVITGEGPGSHPVPLPVLTPRRVHGAASVSPGGCDLRRSRLPDCAATLLISSMVLSARSAQRSSAIRTGGEPSCLVPSGTSSSSTASVPRSARRARRASTTRPAPTTLS